MKLDLTDLNPVKKSLAVEIDAPATAEETNEVAREYSHKAHIPGFRPGKAPREVVLKRFDKQIRDEVRERLMTRAWHAAVKEKGLRPLGDPVVEDLSHEDGAPFRFTAVFEILPVIEVKNYRGIEVRRPAVSVGEADVDKMLEDLRQSRVQLVTEEGRAASTGDVVVADVDGTPDEGDPFTRERVMIELGATDNLPAFNERLEGVTAGATLEFPVDYPKEYPQSELAGRTVGFQIAVHEVKRRQLPDLDDEFAKDLGEFDDLAALRKRVGEDLLARAEHEADSSVRQGLLDKLLLENPAVLPEIMVETEIRHRLEDMVRNMMMRGMDPEKMDLDWKELRGRQEEGARKSVHARLVLDAVAKVEGIEVSDEEANERLRRDAEAAGEKYADFKARVDKHGGIEVLKDQMVREKSLDLMTSVANIQSEE